MSAPADETIRGPNNFYMPVEVDFPDDPAYSSCSVWVLIQVNRKHRVIYVWQWVEDMAILERIRTWLYQRGSAFGLGPYTDRDQWPLKALCWDSPICNGASPPPLRISDRRRGSGYRRPDWLHAFRPPATATSCTFLSGLVSNFCANCFAPSLLVPYFWTNLTVPRSRVLSRISELT